MRVYFGFCKGSGDVAVQRCEFKRGWRSVETHGEEHCEVKWELGLYRVRKDCQGSVWIVM